MAAKFRSLRRSYFAVPVAALIALAFSWERNLQWPILMALGAVLVLTVFVAVHHAEVVALRVGEPFGSLILAFTVTVIEVGMIVVLMLDNLAAGQDLARDTVFSAVMITANGFVGIALLVKTLKQRVAEFNPEGVGIALATLAALSVLSLVLPSLTVSSPGPTFTTTQLVFAAAVSLLLYLTFVFMQTVRHRNYFLPVPKPNSTPALNQHVEPPSKRLAWASFAALAVSLVAVVGLAKVTSPLIKNVVDDLGLPQLVIAVSIALIVLAPEGISAIKAARFGRTQTSLNLAYGSALASIGLTVPVIAIFSMVFNYQVNLGLNPAEIALLFLTFIVSTVTVVSGRASLMQAVLHLAIFGSFLMLVFSP